MTDPGEVSAAMAAGQAAETARGAAGLGAVRGAPPVATDNDDFPFPPLLVQVVGPPPPDLSAVEAQDEGD